MRAKPIDLRCSPGPATLFPTPVSSQRDLLIVRMVHKASVSIIDCSIGTCTLADDLPADVGGPYALPSFNCRK